MKIKVIILSSFCLVLSACISKEEKEKNRTQQVKNFVESVVKEELIDPSSAIFTEMKGFCGKVNSKNRMGGYVGAVRFIVIDSKNVLFESERTIANQQFPLSYKSICKEIPKFDDNELLIPPKFKIIDPVYKKAEYHFSDKHATATPSSLTLNSDFIYIYPVLRLGCDNGSTKVSLWSQQHLSYSSDNLVAVETNKHKLKLFEVTSGEDWQDFGSNPDLIRRLKEADEVKIFFKTSSGNLSLQEFNLIPLKDGMRKYKNNCSWDKF